MAPVAITEDYYMVLEVEQTATPEEITQSYRRLALKVHPDRSRNPQATQAFQRLVKAYEALKDESKRREYDLIHPSITRSRPPPNTQTHRPAPAARAPSEWEQIAALQKAKQEREARWSPKKTALDSSICKIQRDIRQLEQEIKNLDSIAAAEAAEEAQKNGWVTWFLSPIYQKAEDSEEEKARKERQIQERRIEKDMKERRLALKNAERKKLEDLVGSEKGKVDAADLVDDGKIRLLQARIDRLKREEAARIWREQQERDRVQRQEAAISWEKQKERERLLREETVRIRREAQQRQEEQARRERSTHQASELLCRHDGWWPKVEGRTACPKCHEIWTYLLQCPCCKMKACPKCQGMIRPRRNRGGFR